MTPSVPVRQQQKCFFFFFIFNNIYSIDNQQSKILTNTTILTLLTIQYLEYNRLRYFVYNVKTYNTQYLPHYLLTNRTTMHYLQAVLISNCTSKPTFTKPNIHGKRTYILSVLKRQRL